MRIFYLSNKILKCTCKDLFLSINYIIQLLITPSFIPKLDTFISRYQTFMGKCLWNPLT